MQVSILKWACPLLRAARSANLYTLSATLAVAAVLASGSDASAQLTGSRYVTLDEDAPLRCREGDISYAVSTLERGTVLRVVSENGVWLRAAYPDGLLAVVKADEVRYDSVAKSVALLKPSKLRAANESGGERSHWWRLLDNPLPAGTELKVVNVLVRIDGEAEAFMVEAPTGAFGFVRSDQVRAAREQEILAFRRRHDVQTTEPDRAIASATTPATEQPPAVDLVTDVPASQPAPKPTLTIDPLANTERPVTPAPVIEPEPVEPITTITMHDSPSARPSVVPTPRAQPAVVEYTPEPITQPATRPVIEPEPQIAATPDPVVPTRSNAVREITTRPTTTSTPIDADPIVETAASVVIDPVPGADYIPAPESWTEPVSQPQIVVSAPAPAPTRAPAPVRVERPAPRPATVASLGVLFEQIQRQPLLEAELGAALVEFDRTVASLGRSTSDEAARPLLLRQREMLQLRADLQRTLRERQGSLASQVELMEQIESRISRLRDGRSYDLIGRVVPSTVYDGRRLPLMYRVEAYKDGLTRTVGYLRPDRTFDVAPLVGRVAGVRGPAEFDYDLGVAVVIPSTATVLDLNSGEAIVIRDASLEPLSAVDP